MSMGPLVEAIKRSSKTRYIHKTVGGKVEGGGQDAGWTGSVWVVVVQDKQEAPCVQCRCRKME